MSKRHPEMKPLADLTLHVLYRHRNDVNPYLSSTDLMNEVNELLTQYGDEDAAIEALRTEFGMTKH